MKKVRLLLLDVIGGTGFREVTCGELQDYYDNLKCDCFDIAVRNIGGRYFDIFCDDVGLFVEHPIPSAVDDEFNPVLVGNLIFAHHDREGNTTGLSDDDIEFIIEHSVKVVDANTLNTWEVVSGVRY